MTSEVMYWLAPAGVLAGLLFAAFFYRGMLRSDAGSEHMQRIAGHVQRGAMAYLLQQYRIMAAVFLGLVLLFSVLAFGLDLQSGSCLYYSWPEACSPLSQALWACRPPRVHPCAPRLRHGRHWAVRCAWLSAAAR